MFGSLRVLSLAAVLMACQSGEPPAHTGEVPDWFAVAETNGAGRPGVWRSEASGAIRLAETSNTGQTYNLLFADENLTDIEMTVRLRADGGREDQGGGLFWRALGPDDYYVARWNPLEDNLRLYHVIGGKRTQLASADLRADPRAWHQLAVSMEGELIRVGFDGSEVLEYVDGTLSQGGGFGLWTKADAATTFDELIVSGS